MNRAQRRSMKKKHKGRDLGDPVQAQAILDGLSAGELVAGINSSIEILQRRGVSIFDWDNRVRELYRIRIFGRKAYFLAAETGEGKE